MNNVFTKLSLAFVAFIFTINQTASAQAGINWISRTAAAVSPYEAIVYANGLFVAVPNNTNSVMTSPDGITWTTRIVPAAKQWSSITYGAGLFVVVGENGTGNQVMTSPDGITWTLRVSASSDFWTGVTYGGGLFVAVAIGGSSGVMTSPDGINWTLRSSPNTTLSGVTYGGGLFVAIALSGGVVSSPDGITWTSRTTPINNNWRAITYGNNLFVAVSGSGTGNRVMTSSDGITWTSRTSAADNDWFGVTYGNGLFVAVAITGTGNRIMTSPDGINWTTRSSAADNSWFAVAYGNGRFAAVSADGTNRVMTSYTPATGLNFDGVNDYVDCGNILTASYTKEAWINSNNLSVNNNILSGGGAAGDQAFWVPGTKLSAEHNGTVLSDPAALLVNTWYHVAVTYDAPTTTMKLYKNGVLVASSTTMPAYSGGNGIYIGAFTPAANTFSGTIDEVRVWSRALAPGEIVNNMNCSLNPANQTNLKALYHLDQGIVLANNSTVTSVTDASGNNNNGTAANFALTGAVSNWVDGTVSATSCAAAATGLNFDGVDDYVNCGVSSVFNLTASLSVEAWINRSVLGTDDCIIGKDIFANGTGYAFWVYQTNKLILRFSNREYAGLSNIPLNTWTHVAATYNATTGDLKLYVNGVLDNTYTGVAAPVSNTGGLYIGTPQDAVGNSSFAFSGALDEVRIWNRTLCQAEIQNNMNAQLNASAQSGLKAYYKFNQGSVGSNNAGITTAVDSSGGNFNGTLTNFVLTGAASNWVAGAVTGNSSIYIPATLAGTAGGAQVVQTGNVTTAGTYFIENGCGLIAKVLPSGASPVTGNITNKVKIDAAVQTYGGKPYVQRHYDIEPATSPASVTATVTLYFTQAEFTAYNAARGPLPALPTSSADASGIANMRITQYHGTGTAPGNYTGSALMIDPVNSNIIYNSSLSRWEVTIDVSGFSGFYVHTNSTAGPLPLTIVSFTGKNNGNTKLVEWTTSNEINIKEFVLERSTDNSSFKDLVTVTGKGAITNGYAYNDAYNADGIVYYRLRIIDNGGRITYSNTISLSNKISAGIAIFPNPVYDKLNLQVSDKKLVGTTVKLIDATGKTVQTFIIGNTMIIIDVNRLSAGLYMLQTINGDTQKIIKQ